MPALGLERSRSPAVLLVSCFIRSFSVAVIVATMLFIFYAAWVYIRENTSKASRIGAAAAISFLSALIVQLLWGRCRPSREFPPILVERKNSVTRDQCSRHRNNVVFKCQKANLSFIRPHQCRSALTMKSSGSFARFAKAYDRQSAKFNSAG
jgi:hypothetical protein